MQLPSFIFNANTMTPEQLARNRALAEAMLNRGQTGVASNVGEGLAQLGQALGGRLRLSGIDKAMKAGQERAYSGMANAYGGVPAAAPVIGGGGSGGGGGSPVPADNGTVFGNVLRAGKGWTEVSLPDGRTVRREGARNWRNNNPGNIEYGPFAKSSGAIGTDGRFAVFPSYESGRNAKAKLLFESPSYRNKTIAGAISRYAPSFENNTGSYIAQVAAAAGVSPNTPISSLNPQQRIAMLDAMQRVEGFKPGREVPLGSGGAPAPQMLASAQPQAAPAQAPAPIQQAPQIATGPTAAPQIIPTAGPAPQAPQMAPQAPMSAYQRMMAGSLGKEAGGLAAPPNRVQMASVMGNAGPARSPFAATGQGVSPNVPQVSPNVPLGAGSVPQASRSAGLRSFIGSSDFAHLEPAQQQMVIADYNRALEAENPAPVKPIEVGGRLVDPTTGRVVYEPESKPSYRAATPEEKKAAGIPENYPAQIGPDGKIDVLKDAIPPAAKPEEFPAKVREYQYMVEQLKARGVPEKDIPTFEQYGSSNGIALTMPDGSHLTIGGSGKGSGSASLPPEMGARIGLGERYLTTDYPDILPDIKDGSATGPIDYISGYFGRGKSGDVQRRMASGVDALRRNLTGAGMAASEADDYARRYLPQWSDDAETLERKAYGLKADIEAVRDGAIAGKTGNLQLLLPGQKGWGETINESVNSAPGAPQAGAAPDGGLSPQTLAAIKRTQGFTTDQEAVDFLKKKTAEGWTIAPNGVMYQEVK